MGSFVIMAIGRRFVLISNVHGQTRGLKHNQLRRIEKLATRRVGTDSIVSPELARQMTESRFGEATGPFTAPPCRPTADRFVRRRRGPEREEPLAGALAGGRCEA